VTVPHRAWILAAVAIGGALGAVGRYELALAEPVTSGHFPWATFVVNVIGSFALGIAVVMLPERLPSTSVARAFVAVGFCGGLTTFSTWMVESVLLTRDGDGATAALYLLVSLIVGFVAVLAGVAIARNVVGGPAPSFDPAEDD
jgi:CrcB protein